jgi:hypothetical protein
MKSYLIYHNNENKPCRRNILIIYFFFIQGDSEISLEKLVIGDDEKKS